MPLSMMPSRMRAYSPITSEHERRDSYRESNGFPIFASPEKHSKGDNDHGHTCRARTYARLASKPLQLAGHREKQRRDQDRCAKQFLRRLLANRTV